MKGKFSTTYNKREKNRWMKSGYFFVFAGFIPVSIQIILVGGIINSLLTGTSEIRFKVFIILFFIILSLVNLGTLIEFKELRRSYGIIHQDFSIYLSSEETRRPVDLLVDDLIPKLKDALIKEGLSIDPLCDGTAENYILKPGMWFPHRMVIARFKHTERDMSIELEYPSIERSIEGKGFRVNIHRYSKEYFQFLDVLTDLIDETLLPFENHNH